MKYFWFFCLTLHAFSAAQAQSKTDPVMGTKKRPGVVVPSSTPLVFQNTGIGSSGGMHIPDARTMPIGAFRLQLATGFFSADGFLNPDDGNRFVDTRASMAWGLAKNLEFFGTLSATSNRNKSEDPRFIQSVGDFSLGIKINKTTRPSALFHFGGDLRAIFLNSVGSLGPYLKGTSVGLGLNATTDFTQLKKRLPLIARLRAEYYLDNSSNLVSDTERARYSSLGDPAFAYGDETRNLVSRVERFAYGINRVDQVRLNAGTEFPFEIGKGWQLRPMVEWRLGIPVNRQGYQCVFIPAASDPSRPPAGFDSCLNNEGFKALPQTMAVAMRVLPPVRGLAFFGGADVGITGVNTRVRELAPTPPYMIHAGIAYTFDTRAIPATYDATQVKRAAQSATIIPRFTWGKVNGKVSDKETGQPIAHAVIHFKNIRRTALYAEESGEFSADHIEPGSISFVVEHPLYEKGECHASVKANEQVALTCQLSALPPRGGIDGTVLDAVSKEGIASSIHITGPSHFTTESDKRGTFTLANVPTGQYIAKVDSPHWINSAIRFEVETRKVATPKLFVYARPTKPSVVLRDSEIILKKQIRFVENKSAIQDISYVVIEEIAEILSNNPKIKKIEVQGHTDSSGNTQRNTRLSQERADAVRQALVERGIDAARIEAKGYGPSRPLVPNITAKNRSRNRRVQIIILEKS